MPNLPKKDENILYHDYNRKDQEQQQQLQTSIFDEQSFKFTQFIVEDKSTPASFDAMEADLDKQFWAFTDKEASLTNLTEADMPKLMNRYRDTVRFYLATKPQSQYTYQVEQFLAQLEAKFYIKLKRSIGGFERKMIATQIRQNIIEDNAYTVRPSSGILGGIKKFFGAG